MFKNELLTENQYGYMPQKSTTDAVIVAKKFRKQENCYNDQHRLQRPFDAAWWPSILKEMKDLGCPRNLYYLSRYFSQIFPILSTNNVSI